MSEKYLEKLYGAGILLPIENVDLVFSLEVDHLNLSKYTSMIANSEMRDDLDKVNVLHKPERFYISVHMPSQAVDLFWTVSANNNQRGLMTVSASPNYSRLAPFVIYKRQNDANKFNAKYFEYDNSIENMDMLLMLDE